MSKRKAEHHLASSSIQFTLKRLHRAELLIHRKRYHLRKHLPLFARSNSLRTFLSSDTFHATLLRWLFPYISQQLQCSSSDWFLPNYSNLQLLGVQFFHFSWRTWDRAPCFNTISNAFDKLSFFLSLNGSWVSLRVWFFAIACTRSGKMHLLLSSFFRPSTHRFNSSGFWQQAAQIVFFSELVV